MIMMFKLRLNSLEFFIYSKIKCFLRKTYVGRGARIKASAKLISSHVGNYTYVGEDVIANQCTIGAYSSIGPRALLGLAEHNLINASTSTALFSLKPHQKTVIGNDVWIGANAVVKQGIIVGQGAVVGAGSVVTKNVPPYSIVTGIPANVQRSRFDEETISRLLAFNFNADSPIELKQKLSSLNE